MVLVDTSIWVGFLRGTVKRPTAEDLTQFVTCGPIIQEVLQGLLVTAPATLSEKAFSQSRRVGDPVTLDVFLEAAEIYREGRRRGFTVRSSVDCLIAVIAMANRVPRLASRQRLS